MSPVTAQHHRRNILFGTIEFQCNEVSHSGTVKDTCLPDDPLGRKAEDLLHVVGHRGQVETTMTTASGGMFFDARTDLGDNICIFFQ